MSRTLVLVIQVVSMLPDVEGEEGAEAMGDGVVGVGVLSNGQLAGGVGLKPDPAGAKEGGATLDTTEFSVPLLSYQKKDLYPKPIST